MKINCFGIRRSGLHCICYDIVNNLNLNFFNCNNLNEIKKKFNFENTLILYEDMFCNNDLIIADFNIIIIRDIVDNIISRKKSLIDSHNLKCFRIKEDFINKYIGILNEALNLKNNLTNKIVIKYEKYINNYEYRLNILKTLGIKNNKIDCFDKNNIAKQGKSFKKNESRNNVRINNYLLSKYEANQELNQLVYKMYGYNLIKKLSHYKR